jgi:hypothetical protein
LKKINFTVIEIFVALVLCNLDHHFPRQLLLPSCANPRDLLEDFEVLGRIRQFGKSIPADPLDALVHFRNFWFCQHHLHGPIARRHRTSGYYSVGEDPFFPGPPFHLLPFPDFGFSCLQPLYLLPKVLHPLDPCPDLSLSPFRPKVSRLLLFFARRLPPLKTLFAFFIISLVTLCTFLFSDMNCFATRGDFSCTWIVFPGFPFLFGPSRPFPESHRLFFSNYHPTWS